MPEIILHHFEPSPFAEKVRLMLGLKQLAWRSVEIPRIMPKPDLVALTGGYRRTPVLQVGADVYCDTRLIATELESRHPHPTLFPGGQRGLTLALASWSDQTLFEAAVGLSMASTQQSLPADFIKDRREFLSFLDFDRLEEEIPRFISQLRAHADLIDQQLGDGRLFLGGEAPGLMDLQAYFPLWMVRARVPVAAEFFAPFTRLAPWEARVQALGRGRPVPMSAAEAHAVARSSLPRPGAGVDPKDPLRLAAGETVSVAPVDYGKDPVSGRLVTLTLHEVAVQRADPAVGTVVVHFPRIGYRITAAAHRAP
jgi:glutathione S-transferase